MGLLLALFPRSDRQESRVRLQCYFRRADEAIGMPLVDPEETSAASPRCDAAMAHGSRTDILLG